MTAPTRAPSPPLCDCPDAVRMGGSNGVIHTEHVTHCQQCTRMLRYAWVIGGEHWCGRCLFGAGDS